jgi:hypothetical protein
METAASENESSEGKKGPVSKGKVRLELQKSVNTSMRRCRAADGSFRYDHSKVY